MRGLYEVYVVDPETGAYNCWRGVARDEETARLSACMLPSVQSFIVKGIDDYDIIVVKLGAVRPKRTKGE